MSLLMRCVDCNKGSVPSDTRFPAEQLHCAKCASRWHVLSSYAALTLLANVRLVSISTTTSALLLVLGHRGRAIVAAARVHLAESWRQLGVLVADTDNPSAVAHATRVSSVTRTSVSLAAAARSVYNYVHAKQLPTAETFSARSSKTSKHNMKAGEALASVLVALEPAFDPDVLQRKTRELAEVVRKYMEQVTGDVVRVVLRQLGRPYVPGAVLDTSEVIVQLLLLRELQRRVNDGKLVAAVEECQKLADAAAEAAERAGAKPSWLSKKKKREADLKEPRPRPGEERVAVQR